MQIQPTKPFCFNFFKMLRDKFRFVRSRCHTGDWVINHNGYLHFRPVISKLDNGRWCIRITVLIGFTEPRTIGSFQLEQEYRSGRAAFRLAECFAYELAHYFYPYSHSLR